MDELVNQIIRRTDIEEEQARLIIKLVTAYECEELLRRPHSDDDAALVQRVDQRGLESLSGRGFLG